ncbi:MAG: hypothetical protein ACLRZG_08375 [Streptococcus sp.]
MKFSLTAKGLYWKSYGPLIFRNPCSKWPVELDRTFLTYIQQQLFYRHPKWLKLQGRTLYAGTPSDGTGAGFSFLSPLCRPILSQNLLQIEGDVEGYYQRFMTYYQSRKGSNPFQITSIPHVFYAQLEKR